MNCTVSDCLLDRLNKTHCLCPNFIILVLHNFAPRYMSGLPYPSLNGKDLHAYCSTASALWWIQTHNTIYESNTVPHLLVCFLILAIILGQALKTSYQMDFMHLARLLLKAAPAKFKPYKALKITADFPSSLPNSEPKVVHIFSVIGALMYAFKMSPNLTQNDWGWQSSWLL